MNLEQLVSDNLAKLPDLCYALLACNAPVERIVVIKRGERGYYKTDLDSDKATLEQARDLVDHMNGKLEVTPQQKEAMIVGSMCGWHIPGADPDRYQPH